VVTEQHSNGRGRIEVALIGAGIGESLSPALHEREGRLLGFDYRYRLEDLDQLGVEAEDIGALVEQARADGLHGLNITYPCKQTVLPTLDRLTPEAAALGAGGAGAAVAHAILSLGAGHAHILDVDHARADGLAGSLRQRFGSDRASSLDRARIGDVLGKADGLIHATPTGMRDHPGTAVPAELLHPSLWVAEVVYLPLETQLLRDARRCGCRTLDGGGMVAFQAAGSLELFTGVSPDRGRMMSHLAELVAPQREEARCEPQSQPSR